MFILNLFHLCIHQNFNQNSLLGRIVTFNLLLSVWIRTFDFGLSWFQKFLLSFFDTIHPLDIWYFEWIVASVITTLWLAFEIDTKSKFDSFFLHIAAIRHCIFPVESIANDTCLLTTTEFDNNSATIGDTRATWGRTRWWFGHTSATNTHDFLKRSWFPFIFCWETF